MAQTARPLAGMLLGALIIAPLPLAAEDDPYGVPKSFAPSDMESGTYVLDKRHSALLFFVGHMGFSDYVGRFNAFDATLTFDAADPTRSTLVASIEAGSIDVNFPDFEAELKGEEVFKTASFPTISFVATGIEKTSERTGRITGDMTMLGVTRPLTLEVTFSGSGAHPFRKHKVLGFKATGTLERSAFGLSNWMPIVGDAVRFEVHTEFHRQE